MESNNNAVITVVGKNAVGILAKVATCVAKANGNVMQVSQAVMGGFFTMSMLVNIDDLIGSIQDLNKTICNELPGMEIHVMHENIFDSMHTI